MKFFVIFCLVAVPFIVASPAGTNSNKEAESADEVEVSSSSQAADLTRQRKSAGYGDSAPAAPSYGGSSSYSGMSMPAPPCPKNYMFSCQPNLAPVPCAAPSVGYGSSGAYSAPVPTYISPYNYAPQAYGYPNQFYQY